MQLSPLKLRSGLALTWLDTQAKHLGVDTPPSKVLLIELRSTPLMRAGLSVYEDVLYFIKK